MTLTTMPSKTESVGTLSPCSIDCPRLCCFSQWLVTLLAPVIIGSKPAEILSFHKSAKDYYKDVAELDACSNKCQKLNLRRINCSNDTTKFFFYDPVKLGEVLSNEMMLKFLQRLGYPSPYTLDTYLDILCSKLAFSDHFPHEIGAFLGYPLKDIMGFMGHANLQLTEVSKWRVYGDPRISLKKMADFDQAKDKMNMMLKTQSPDFIFENLA